MLGPVESVQAFEASLLSPSEAKGTRVGAIVRLRKYLNKPDSWPRLLWVDGVDVEDVRYAGDAAKLDLAFRRAIRNAQDASAGCAVVACISGGRKTMNAGLHMAMCLLARPQDLAFHVLVRPQAVDLNEADVHQSPLAFPGGPAWARSWEVELDCIDAPLIRLRDVAIAQGFSFEDEALIANLQQALELPKLYINLVTRALSIERAGTSTRLFRLQPQQVILVGACARIGRPAVVGELWPHIRAITQLWGQHPAAPPWTIQEAEIFISPDCEGRVTAIQAPASRFRSRLAEALKRIDPRLVDIFAFQKGTHANSQIGFSSEACRHICLVENGSGAEKDL